MKYNSDLIEFLFTSADWLRGNVDITQIDTTPKIASAMGVDTTIISRWNGGKRSPSLGNFVNLYGVGKDYFFALPLWIDNGIDVFYEVPEVDFKRPVFLDPNYVITVADSLRIGVDELSERVGEELTRQITIPVLGKLYQESNVSMFLPLWPEYVVIQPDQRNDSKRVVIGSSYTLERDLQTMRLVAPDLVVLARWEEDPREEIIFKTLSSYIKGVNRKKEYVSDIEQFLRCIDDLGVHDSND